MDLVRDVLGLDAESLSIGQAAVRAAIVYAVALAFVRIGDKRFLGKGTAFDVAVAIMFGSVMSRAITDPALFPVVVGGGVLVALHYVTASLAYRSDRIGELVKGRVRTLVIDGGIRWDQMAAAHVTERDLRGAIRTGASVDDLSRVKVARLPRRPGPRPRSGDSVACSTRPRAGRARPA